MRRVTLAARLEAIYGSLDRLDAFVGMLAEQHIPGTEFGELQLRIRAHQSEALRDGDRFFYLNDPSLQIIEQRYGVGYRTADRDEHEGDRPSRRCVPDGTRVGVTRSGTP